MFSVIIPIFNKLPHLSRSIGSVLNQSYSDFELILVDDGSKDGSWEWIQNLNDPRIEIFRRENPGPGGYAARNLGVRKAKREWVAFLDADDEWIPQRLMLMAELAQQFPMANFLSSGWREYFHETKERLDFYYQNNHSKGPHELDIFTFLNEKQPIWTSVAVIRKSLYEKTGGFNEEFRKGGDIELWFRVFLEGKRGAWLNQITATYFKNSINMVTKIEKGIVSDTLDTIKQSLKNESNPIINNGLINYKNKLVYLKCKNLILFDQPFRKFLWNEYNFKYRSNFKVFLASIFIYFAPSLISKKLIKKYIL